MIQFVQWLSKKLDKTPGEIVNMLNNESEETIKKYTDQFLAESEDSTEAFRNGGKIESAVRKFQKGGDVDYHKWLSDIGYSTGGAALTDEELRLLDNDMRKRYMKETGKNIFLNMKPRSNRLQIAGGDLPLRNGTTEQRSFDRIRVYNGEGKPDTQIDKIYYTNRPNAGSTERRITGSDTTFVNNYVNPNTRRSVFTKENPYDEDGNNMYERYQNAWKQYGIYQDGGQLTRREALDAFMANREGATRAEARKALRSAKMSFDINGLDGNRRQFARQTIARSNEQPIAESEISNLVSTAFSKETPYGMMSRLHNQVPQTIETSDMVYTTPEVDYRGTFNQAFAAARKAGVSEFGWNGKRYTTDLAKNDGWRSPEPGYSNEYWKYYNPKFWRK